MFYHTPFTSASSKWTTILKKWKTPNDVKYLHSFQFSALC